MDEIETPDKRETSFVLALTCSILSYGFIFLETFNHHFGIAKLNFVVLMKHPQALTGLMAEALGAFLLFPLLHVAVASMFESKRNSSSRRRIFIGWSLVLMGFKTLTLLLGI